MNWAAGEDGLHVAARVGHLNIVQQLLAAGADPTVRDKYGKTAFDYAAFWTRCDVAALCPASLKKRLVATRQQLAAAEAQREAADERAAGLEEQLGAAQAELAAAQQQAAAERAQREAAEQRASELEAELAACLLRQQGGPGGRPGKGKGAAGRKNK